MHEFDLSKLKHIKYIQSLCHVINTSHDVYTYDILYVSEYFIHIMHSNSKTGVRVNNIVMKIAIIFDLYTAIPVQESVSESPEPWYTYFDFIERKAEPETGTDCFCFLVISTRRIPKVTGGFCFSPRSPRCIRVNSNRHDSYNKYEHIHIFACTC